MQTLYTVVLVAHVLASTVGLLSLLPPLVATKGGRVHARAGRIFVRSMMVSALTGAALAVSWMVAPALFRSHEAPANARVGGAFLLLIGTLTGNAVLTAMRALDRKRAPAPQANPRTLGSVVALALVALGSLVAGIAHGHVLSLLFGALSLFVAAGDLAFACRPLSHPRAYLYQHIRSMGTASISAVTAFAVIGGRRLLGDQVLGDQAWVLWVLPGLLLGPLFARWVRVYKRKFEGAPTRALAASKQARPA
ncbi:MAG: hypothetical protein ABW252_14575 [Polyangiales bacterium]